MLRNAAPIVSGAGRERARNVAFREPSGRQKRIGSTGAQCYYDLTARNCLLGLNNRIALTAHDCAIVERARDARGGARAPARRGGCLLRNSVGCLPPFHPSTRRYSGGEERAAF